MMRAELYRHDEPEVVLATARWDGDAHVEPAPGRDVEGLDRIFRPTPVVVDDPSLRRLGTHGESVLQPDSLEWFRAALLVRAPEIGLSVRFVPEVREGGWDPAANYRTFAEQIDRLSSSAED